MHRRLYADFKNCVAYKVADDHDNWVCNKANFYMNLLHGEEFDR